MGVAFIILEMMSMTHCDLCNKQVDYTIKSTPQILFDNGTPIEYSLEKAYCNHCGEEVYPQDLINSNVQRLSEIYKRRNHV